MRILAKDFLSWKELDFELSEGVTLIQGYNHDDETPEGSGKSAILNALSWGTYGKIPKDAKVDDVIREGSKSCEVEIHYPTGHTVKRTRGPNDLVLIKPDGEEIRGKDARETQQIIIDFVGVSFETFCQSIYFAQNYPNKFITANQEDKGKILSEIQDLKQFDAARKKAQEQIRELKPELVGLEKEVEKAQAMLDSALENEEDIQNMIDSFEDKKASEIKELEESLKQSKKEQKTIQAEIKELSEAIENFSEETKQNEIEEYEEALEELSELKAKKKAELESIDSKVQEVERAKKQYKRTKMDLSQAEAKIKSLEKKKISNEEEVEELVKAISDQEEVVAEQKRIIDNPEPQPCPTCGQDWDGNTEHLEKELRKEERGLKKLVSQLKTLRDDAEGYDEDLEYNKSKIKELKATMKDLKEASEVEVPSTVKLEEVLENIQSDISGFKESTKKLKKEVEDYKSAKQNLEHLSKTLELKEQEVEKIEDSIVTVSEREPTDLRENLKKASKSVKVQKDKVKKNQKAVKENKGLMNRLETLKDGYREVKVYVFQSVLDELTRKANNYLAELFEVPVVIKFDNEDMKIDVSIQYDGIERTLGLLSGGQFRRVCLAVDLALSDITAGRKDSRMNLLILDEYFKDLSEVSMEKVLTLLESRDTPTVMVEHNSIFKSIVNNVFEVELIDKVSRAK